MASDDFRKLRAKVKYTTEVRFEPMVEAFDRRGQMLKALFGEFRKKMGHWSGENVGVLVADDLENPLRQIRVEHRRAAITYEDPGSLDEFISDSERALSLVYSVYRDAIPEVHRLGVRWVSVFEMPKQKSFEGVREAIMGMYLSPKLPLTVEVKDFSLTLTHEAGQLVIGPMKKGEHWMSQMFSLPEKGAPEFGLAVDVDSYATGVRLTKENDLVSAFRKVVGLTQAAEAELVGQFLKE